MNILQMGEETSTAMGLLVVVNVELKVDIRAINNISKNTLELDFGVIIVTIIILICRL